MTMQGIRYPSKVDWWILLSLAMVPIGMAIVVIVVPQPVVWVISGGVMLFVAAMCFPCDYTLGDDELVVRSGFIKYRVPYAKINKVEPTRNPLSSPAFSLDRLAINYDKKFLMISPVRKEEFLTELRVKARLTRVGATDAYTRVTN